MVRVVRPNVTVQRRTAQRTVRWNRLLGLVFVRHGYMAYRSPWPFLDPPWQEKGSRGRRPIRCPYAMSLLRESFLDQPIDRTHAANERQAIVSATKNWTSKTKTRDALAQSVTGWILRVLQRS